MVEPDNQIRKEASQNAAMPLVSVIIPAYNAATWIPATLRSVLAQTYHNIEVLVVDDGSQDATPEIVQAFAAQDSRVTLLQQNNSGVAAARNLAIAQATGEYIAPIDADDIWYPQNLEKQVRCILQANSSVGLVYAWSLYIDEQDQIIWSYVNHEFLYTVVGNAYPALLYRNFIDNASAPLIRRSCFAAVGGYDASLRAQNAQGCEDWDLYLRIAERYDFAVVPEFLIGYRQITHSMSMNTAAMEKSYRLTMQAARQRCPDTPDWIHRWSRSCFYVYLFGKSCSSGDVVKASLWGWCAVTMDSVLLVAPFLYRRFLRCFANFLLKPLNIRQRQATSSGWRSRLVSDTRTLANVIAEAKLTQPSQKFYDRLLLHRWESVLDWGASAPAQSTVLDPTFGTGQLHESHSGN